MANTRKQKSRKVTYQDQVFTVPVINRQPTPTEQDKITVGLYICAVYALNTHNLAETCKMFGIGRTTLYSWVVEIEQIEQAFKEAKVKRKDRYSEGITERAMTAAERLLSTDPYKTRQIKYRLKSVTSEQLLTLYEGGDIKGKIAEVEVIDTMTERQPHAQATLAVLYNEMRERYTRNPEPIRQEVLEENIPITQWVDKESKDPETEELKALLDGSQ